LGVRRDTEVRIYGEIADHDRAHGLNEPSITLAVKEFIRA
jgi:transketolase